MPYDPVKHFNPISTITALGSVLLVHPQNSARSVAELVAAAKANPGNRLLPESFMVIRQASGVPKARGKALAYLASFIEDAKRSGLVERQLRESGITDVSVAP